MVVWTHRTILVRFFRFIPSAESHGLCSYVLLLKPSGPNYDSDASRVIRESREVQAEEETNAWSRGVQRCPHFSYYKLYMYRSYTNYRGAWKPIPSPRLETRVRHLLVRLGIEYSHRTCEETEAKGRMLAGAHEYRKPDLNSYKSAGIGLYSKQSE